MGWLWASPSPPKPSTPVPQDKPAAPPLNSSAPNEPIDPEIQKFFDLFKSDTSPSETQQPSTASTSRTAPSSSSTTDSTATSSSPSKVSSWLSLRASSTAATPPQDQPHGSAPPRDELSEALLPTSMSCRQAFDQAWACNNVGGQWNAVYRDGAMRSCSPLWDDFWFCMRTRSLSGEQRDKAVQQYYRDKEYAKYYAPGRRSSEDVWEARTKLVEPGTTFDRATEMADVNDDDWRQAEAERRRAIRQKLGFDTVSA